MRKLTRRSYNRKLIVFGLAIFLAFGMISTGFAAWLISSAATVDADAPVEVDKIVDESFELTIDQLDENNDWDGALISFDAKKDDADGRVQFQANGDSDGGEQLNLTLSGTVTNVAALGKNPESTDDKNEIKIEIALPDSLKAAITAKYLTVKYTVGTGGSDVAFPADNTIWVAPDASTGVFSITLKFAWGTAFKNENPGVYFDTEYADSTAETPLGKAVTDAAMKEQLAAFRATLIGAETSDADVLTREYTGTITFTVTASASY